MSVEDNYARFYEWIKQNGGRIHEHVKIENKQERGLFTTSVIEPCTALAIVPRSLVLNIHHPDISIIGTDTERQTLIVFLLREHSKQDASHWYPWLRLLAIDQEAIDLLTAKMHLFDCVEFSTLGQALTARYRELQEEYEQLAQSDTIDSNFDTFCAVDHLVWSRVLGLPEGEPLSLVPLFDFANHSFDATARWFIDDETHDLILRSERTLNSGEEITISYGPKSNEELLYLYGFSLPSNPHDRITIPVCLSPNDPLLETKLCSINEWNLPPRLMIDSNGHLTSESTRLTKLLTAKSESTIDEINEHYSPYLLDLFNNYLSKLHLCRDDQVYIKQYLDSQKRIIQLAIENLK